MRDKKFAIAIIIIILLTIALIYVVFLGPKIQGYFIQKDVAAQEKVVRYIIDLANQNGYVVLTTGNESIILVKYNASQQASNL
ncbi:MAG: hypothetical protein QXI33_01655 [Candidatus Pacearchaeota archaeon]